MPETTVTPPPADNSEHTIALSAATMGHDLCAALLAELRTMPEHWPKLNEQMQQKIIERLKTKVSEAVLKAQHMLTTSEFQAVPATLEYVNRKDGIRAGLTVASDALCRHALFDASGGKVLVVIVDPERWLHRMDQLKATGNQADLFTHTDANYDPAKDQPGYRRDQDPFAPAPSWDAMKQSLGLTPPADETKPPEGETKAADPETPAAPAGDDEAVDGTRVDLEMLRDRLAGAGIMLSLGALQSASAEDILALTNWLDHIAGAALPSWCPAPKPLKKGDKK